MKFRPISIIYGLTLYIPFEDFILKWLPVSSEVYSYSRFASELLIYSLLLLVISNKIINNNSIQRTPIDLPLLTFISIGIASIIVNSAPLLGGIIGIRTLLRYVAIYYIIVNIHINTRQIRRFLLIIISIGVAESLIAVIQYFSGLNVFWLPRDTNLEIAGYTKSFNVLAGEIEKGAVIGTLGHTINMSLYLLITFIITLSIIYVPHRISGIMKLFLFILLFLMYIAITFTYSISSSIASLLAIPIVLIHLKRKKILLRYTALGLVLLSSLVIIAMIRDNNIAHEYTEPKKDHVSSIDNIRLIFSSDYLKRTEGSRQWILREVGSTLINSFTLIGYSPDEKTARNRIVDISEGSLHRLLTHSAFEDVYWIAILAYFGLVGLSLYIWILFKLYACAIHVIKKSGHYYRSVIGTVAASLVIITGMMTFLVRTFEFRAFGFHFWLLAGLMMSSYLDHNDKAVMINAPSEHHTL